ncbi:hypothetical protein Tcan_00910, partial [Toxocara canis]
MNEITEGIQERTQPAAECPLYKSRAQHNGPPTSAISVTFRSLKAHTLRWHRSSETKDMRFCCHMGIGCADLTVPKFTHDQRSAHSFARHTSILDLDGITTTLDRRLMRTSTHWSSSTSK